MSALALFMLEEDVTPQAPSREVQHPELWLSAAVVSTALHDLDSAKRRRVALHFLRHVLWRSIWWQWLEPHVPRPCIERAIAERVKGTTTKPRYTRTRGPRGAYQRRQPA